MIRIHLLNPFITNISVPTQVTKRDTYSDRFGNQLSEYSDMIGPQLTQKYAKLQSFPNQSHGVESDLALEVVRDQQYDFIKQMKGIPMIPDDSFEVIETSCRHGECIRKKI